MWILVPGCQVTRIPRGPMLHLKSVSLHLSLSTTFHPSTYRKLSNISWIRRISISLWQSKYFPGHNLVTGSYGNVCSQSDTLCLAGDGHCLNSITSKWDLTAKAGSPDTMGYFSFQSQTQESKSCHVPFKKDEGVCAATWDLIIINPDSFEHEENGWNWIRKNVNCELSFLCWKT